MISRMYQTKVWIAADGRQLKIKKMDPEHVKNVLAYLRRNAEVVAMAEYLYLFTVPWGDAEPPEEIDLMATQPRRWLESTPLVRELVRVDIRNEFRIARWYGALMPEMKA